MVCVNNVLQSFYEGILSLVHIIYWGGCTHGKT